MADSPLFSRVDGWLAKRRLQVAIKRREKDLPAEYLPWLLCVASFVRFYVDGFDDLRRRGEHRGGGGLMLGLVIVGIARAFTELHELTSGQERHLTIEVLARSGWTYDDATMMFDMSLEPTRLLPDDLADAANEAMASGHRIGMHEWAVMKDKIDQLTDRLVDDLLKPR